MIACSYILHQVVHSALKFVLKEGMVFNWGNRPIMAIYTLNKGKIRSK